MDDEFALCWNNFQENISTGFQLLYDRGDLVDCTIAVDGKLLHCHKIVLAICSQYFQEIFNTNPCKHPIIILKDVSFNVMCELLQFMYQGVVNVKHAELSSFMKIAQTLQIKGLATASTSSQSLQQQMKSPRSTSPKAVQENIENKPSTSNFANNNNNNQQSSRNNNANNLNISENSSSSVSSSAGGPISLKRLNEFPTDSLSVYSRKQFKRNSSIELTEQQNNDSMDQINSGDDVFLPPIPHISIGGGSSNDPRFDLTSVKREINETQQHQSQQQHSSSSPSPGTSQQQQQIQQQQQQLQQQQPPQQQQQQQLPPQPPRNPHQLPPPFNLEYNMYAAAAVAAANNKNFEYPGDIHMTSSAGPSDYSSKGGNSSSNHMDIPPVAPGERWFHGKLEFMLSQRGKPLLVHDGHTFGIQYIRKDKKYWQCNLSRKFNCKARVTTTDQGEIIVTNNEHCHTEIRQHLRKDYQRNKILNALNNSIQERMLNVSNEQSARPYHHHILHNQQKPSFNPNFLKAHFLSSFSRNAAGPIDDDFSNDDDDDDDEDKFSNIATNLVKQNLAQIWQQVSKNNINNDNNNNNNNNNNNSNNNSNNDNNNEGSPQPDKSSSLKG